MTTIRGTSRHVLICFSYAMCVAVLSGCIAGSVEELPASSPKARIIGDTYRIISDDVYAFGIYAPDERVVSEIQLFARIGPGGSRVAFKRPISKGQELRIVSAWLEHGLLPSPVYYVVGLEDSSLPPDVEVTIRLSLDNVGEGGGLNPRV